MGRCLGPSRLMSWTIRPSFEVKVACVGSKKTRVPAAALIASGWSPSIGPDRVPPRPVDVDAAVQTAMAQLVGDGARAGQARRAGRQDDPERLTASGRDRAVGGGHEVHRDGRDTRELDDDVAFRAGGQRGGTPIAVRTRERADLEVDRSRVRGGEGRQGGRGGARAVGLGQRVAGGRRAGSEARLGGGLGRGGRRGRRGRRAWRRWRRARRDRARARPAARDQRAQQEGGDDPAGVGP